MLAVRDSKVNRPPGVEFIFAGISGMGAACITNPVDVLKIRLQLQGELEARGTYKKIYRNTVHAAYVIARHEGLIALQSGLVPALFYQICLNGARLGTYHFAKRYGIILNEKNETSIVKTSLVCGFAGVCGAVIGSPFYLVKTQLQSQSANKSIAVGLQHQHKNMIDAFRHIGLSGLYRGWYANVPKVIIGSATQLTVFGLFSDLLSTYDTFKDKPLLSTFVASFVSGCCLTVVLVPLDVMAIRLYNNLPTKGKGIYYNGIFDALYKIFRIEGFFALYKGLVPVLLRSTPHVVLCQVFYEKLSQFYDEVYLPVM